MEQRDHVFISYATEDAALADWLARKLASLGYAVWYDRIKLLGGEPWPKDIDLAIKSRTFRMLAMLSHASIHKDNPSRERTTAQAVGRELHVPDFLITLNVDGLKPTEIPWTLSEINYIPFSPSWAEGLATVVKKLVSVSTPCVLTNGPRLAVESCDLSRFIRPQPEQLCSNCFPLRQLPRKVVRCETKFPVAPYALRTTRGLWASRRLAPNRLVAFEEPPDDIREYCSITSVQPLDWPSCPTLDGVCTRDLLVSLIHASADTLFASRGLIYSQHQDSWFIPSGLLDGDWLRYTKPDGSVGRLLAVGERTFRSGTHREPYRYHLSPSLSVLRGSDDPFVLVFRNRVYLTDADGKPLDRNRIPSRRKHLCKNWWNDDWLGRMLGMIRLLAGEDDCIRIGAATDSQIIVETRPLLYEVPVSLDETEAELPDGEFLGRDDDEEDEVSDVEGDV